MLILLSALERGKRKALRSANFNSRGTGRSYLVVRCQGRLGNMMFQYASLYGMAKTNGLIPLFYCRSDEMHVAFRLSIARTLTCVQNVSRIPAEPCCIYKRTLTTDLVPVRNYSVHGYLQSWKYFATFFKEIRGEFEFSSPIRERCQSLFRQALDAMNATENSTIIGIHVRRGDLLDLSRVAYGYVAAKSEFIAKAVAYGLTALRTKTDVFFIISGDDYAWNKRHSPDYRNTYILRPTAAAMDMCLLSMCDSVFFSTGTYGWWSAFLANGPTFYERQFCQPGSKLCQVMREEDFYLPSWTGI